MNILFCSKFWVFVATTIIAVAIASTTGLAASQDMELVQAAWDGNIPRATLALNNGANPNAVAPVAGWTPLLSASWRGKLQIVRTLLDCGALVNTKDPLGWTPLMVAAKRGHDEVVKALLEAGAAVNSTTHRNTTALMLACEAGHLKVVELLLNNGAQTNEKTASGLTALSLARKNGNPDVVNFLINFRAAK